MHVGILHLAAVISLILHGDRPAACSVGTMVDIHDLATILRGQYGIALGLDVDTLVHLLLATSHRIGAHTER